MARTMWLVKKWEVRPLRASDTIGLRAVGAPYPRQASWRVVGIIHLNSYLFIATTDTLSVLSATKRIPDQVGDDLENNSPGACAPGLFRIFAEHNDVSCNDICRIIRIL